MPPSKCTRGCSAHQPRRNTNGDREQVQGTGGTCKIYFHPPKHHGRSPRLSPISAASGLLVPRPPLVPEAAGTRQDSHVKPVASALSCPSPLQGLRANIRGVNQPAASHLRPVLPPPAPRSPQGQRSPGTNEAVGGDLAQPEPHVQPAGTDSILQPYFSHAPQEQDCAVNPLCFFPSPNTASRPVFTPNAKAPSPRAAGP